MTVTTKNCQKRFPLLSIKHLSLAICLLVFCSTASRGQCLSAVNPVGGSHNLLVLEKNTLRVISFYRFHYGNRYFEGDSPANWDLIRYAGYHYAGAILGYGLTKAWTLETEWGYFIQKTQIYRGDPEERLRGNGFSSTVVSLKRSLVKDDIRRFFVSASGGARIPLSRELQVRNGVVLPIEVQPAIGAWGSVFQLFLVKEIPVSGTRYFVTSRVETGGKNRDDYQQGKALYTSLFYSKHLMLPWLKGDWTAILQLRNEWRGKDHTAAGVKESSGGHILYLSPQINSFIIEKWNLSMTLDLPVYQYFNGTQMSSRCGVSLNLARDFSL